MNRREAMAIFSRLTGLSWEDVEGMHPDDIIDDIEGAGFKDDDLDLLTEAVEVLSDYEEE